MVKLDFYWHNWAHRDELTYEYLLNDDAPEEAIESYERYYRQISDIDRRTGRSFTVPKTIDGMNWFEENGCDNYDCSHETEHYVFYNIPYNEFCVLRQIDDIDELIDEYEAKRLSLSRIEEYIDLLETVAPELTEIINVLKLAMKCGTYVDFSEDHII